MSKDQFAGFDTLEQLVDAYILLEGTMHKIEDGRGGDPRELAKLSLRTVAGITPK